jgi:WD40 repeat protein
VNLWRLDEKDSKLAASLTLQSNSRGSSRREEVYFDDIYAVAWHPDGRHLVVGGHDRRVQILDIGREMTVMRSLTGHDAGVVEVVVAFYY